VKSTTTLGIAVADSLAMLLVVSYGAWRNGTSDIVFALFFYLTIVMVILGKLGVWAWVVSECVHDERDERKDTKYEYRYRDGIVVPDMDKLK